MRGEDRGSRRDFGGFVSSKLIGAGEGEIGGSEAVEGVSGCVGCVLVASF